MKIRLSGKRTMRIQRLVKRIKHYLFPGTLILLYHRVIDLQEDTHLLAVNPKNFRAQIAYLQDQFHVISLDDLTTSLQKGIVPKNSLVITFDDGYGDNYTYAKPILEQLQVPATIFVATGNLGRDEEFWWDALSRLPIDRKKQEELHARFKQMSPARVRSSLQRLSSQFSSQVPVHGYPRPGYRAMNSKELRAMASSGLITFGAHTHSHIQLAHQTKAVQRKEILTSKSILEKILKREVKHFSYPFGTKDDYNQESITIVKELGFTSACSNFPGAIDKRTSPYELPRFLVRNWDKREFAKRIRDFFCW